MSGPERYAVDAPRSNELVAWLKCNDVNPSDVPYPSRIFVETADGTDWVIRYDTYVRTVTGTIKFDFATETFEYTEAVAPLLNDPPMGWLKGTAPSGLQGTRGGRRAAQVTWEQPGHVSRRGLQLGLRGVPGRGAQV